MRVLNAFYIAFVLFIFVNAAVSVTCDNLSVIHFTIGITLTNKMSHILQIFTTDVAEWFLLFILDAQRNRKFAKKVYPFLLIDAYSNYEMNLGCLWREHVTSSEQLIKCINFVYFAWGTFDWNECIYKKNFMQIN